MAQTKTTFVFVLGNVFQPCACACCLCCHWRTVFSLPSLGIRTVRASDIRPFYIFIFCDVCTGEILMSFAREASRAIRSTLVLWVISAIIYPFAMIALGQ